MAAAFGALLAAVKGEGGGVRLAFGNVSAPWLLVAFLAGARVPRAGRAAALGVLATFAALVGFYAEPSPLLGLDARSLSFLGDPAQVFRFIVATHTAIFLGGAISGAAFGALGGLWARQRTPIAPRVMAAMFIAEPFAWLAFAALRGGGVGFMTHEAWLWVAEVALGLAGLLAATRAVAWKAPERLGKD
jgi:hypothetical protein